MTGDDGMLRGDEEMLDLLLIFLLTSQSHMLVLVCGVCVVWQQSWSDVSS